MAIKTIVTIPNEVLVQKCVKAKTLKSGELDEQTKSLITDLKETLANAKNPEGAGLAAPQIGVLKRVCIARKFMKDPGSPKRALIEDVVLVNPKVITFSKGKDIDWEGCLSIPNTYGKVERSRKIKVRFTNENGTEVQTTATGFFARVIQHEIDHLDGILFTTKTVGKTLTEQELDKLYPEPQDEMGY